MSGMNIKRFLAGYSIQKVGEFVILSVSYTAVLYIGSRGHAEPWGILAPEPFSASQSLLAALALAGVFFLFTLYPLAVLLPLLLVRWLLRKNYKALIPFASATLSIAYVQIWVVMMGDDFKLFPDWTVSALVIAFIIASSFKLYPEFSGKHSNTALRST